MIVCISYKMLLYEIFFRPFAYLFILFLKIYSLINMVLITRLLTDIFTTKLKMFNALGARLLLTKTITVL